MPSQLYIGLMSGTSLDGIDAALIRFDQSQPHLLGALTYPIPAELHAELLALTQPGSDEIERMGQADIRFAALQAEAVHALLTQTAIKPDAVRAIGSHGQTIRHRPALAQPFTLQIGDPNTLAERAHIDVVADFRRRDMAAGGQGAPLVPAFHADLFRSANQPRVILNIGGMANITLLPNTDGQAVTGFDTGPGNVLLDACIQQHCQLPFDRDGAWAASGHCQQQLLEQLLNETFFSAAPPKSTGRELFNPAWLARHLAAWGQSLAPADLQATLLELTARSITDALAQHAPTDAAVYVCGGGAHNHFLLQRLRQLRPSPPLFTTEQLGLHPDWVEATAFAWLAKQFMERQPGNLATVTGARGPRVLGALYPA